MDAFRIFGMDGTGGYAAFWLVRPDAELADGLGPLEASDAYDTGLHPAPTPT